MPPEHVDFALIRPIFDSVDVTVSHRIVHDIIPFHGITLAAVVLSITTLARMSHKFEKRCEARQSKARAESVLEHVTKRVAAITPPRALLVLRFLLNKPKNMLCFRSKLTTCSHPNSYTRSAETGEIFGLELL